MKIRVATRAYTALFLAAAALLWAAPAQAQYRPRPLNDPSTGEVYHIEGFAGFWFPRADMSIASEQFGLQGSKIDFKNDLGLDDQRFANVRVTLRPVKSFKLRFEYTPIKYEQSSTLKRDIVFNGQNYPTNLPVNSSLEWHAYRFALEEDFISKDRWFIGLVLEAKYTDVKAQLDTPLPVCKNNLCAPLSEFTHARAPIPALGGIGRVYIVPNIAVTVEVTGFRLPDNLIKNTQGHYVDVDVYGTLNFTNNIGVQAGFRSLNVGYFVKPDSGDFKLKGAYFGLVARY